MPREVIRSADGTELSARRSGSGSPLVLVHGTNGGIGSFALIEEPLAKRHSVWVYDRRGRGGSGDGPRYDAEREVEDVLAVLGAAGEDAHLVGHSFGAVCCLLAAMRSPSLRSLVLYEPPLRVDRVDIEIVDEAQTALDEGDSDRALSLFFPIAGVTTEEAQALQGLEPVWARLRDGVRQAPRELFALYERRDELTSFEPPEVPTLYLYGEKTVSSSFATADELGELLPKARVQCLRQQRHLAFAFDPGSFAEAILAFTGRNDS